MSELPLSDPLTLRQARFPHRTRLAHCNTLVHALQLFCILLCRRHSYTISPSVDNILCCPPHLLDDVSCSLKPYQYIYIYSPEHISPHPKPRYSVSTRFCNTYNAMHLPRLMHPRLPCHHIQSMYACTIFPYLRVSMQYKPCPFRIPVLVMHGVESVIGWMEYNHDAGRSRMR